MKQEIAYKFNYYSDFFQDSEQCRNLPLYDLHHLSSDFSHSHGEQYKKQPHEGNTKTQKDKKLAISSKLQKSNKIRTNRNVQKTYHNILKHWLQNHQHAAILPKYNEFFNQRVYFILVLDEITKQIDGQQFALSYQKLARDVIAKKQNQVFLIEQKKQQCQQAQHLRRVIEQIEFSIKACKEFIAGNVLDSLETVYKRNQSRITKMKEFQKALQTYREVTGRQPVNF